MLFSRSGSGANFERLIVLQQPSIGLRGIVAIHSTRRGPAFGGIRRVRYASDEAALADALELAESMSLKCALAGLPAGGGKTVLLEPTRDQNAAQWPEVYAALGRAIDELQGTYVCGPDLGTSTHELAIVRERTRWVNPAGNDAGQSTAAGVLAGLRAVWTILGDRVGRTRVVTIQGLGSVGRAIAAALVDQGVRVIAADPRPEACDAVASLGVELVAAREILEVPCDVLMPCANGHMLTRDTVSRLRCKAVCGSANNQLEDDEAAMLLMRAGIVHAPDIVVSAGAVIEGVLTVCPPNDAEPRASIAATIANLEAVTGSILAEAQRTRRPPVEIARARGWALLAA
jgi:glutamate dehydrogenase/leucine dehydrogenase